MLKIENKTNLQVSCPAQLIRQAQHAVNGFARKKAAGMLCASREYPTLLELDTASPGQCYDLFDIDCFSILPQKTDASEWRGKIHAFVSLTASSKTINMRGWILKKSTEEVLCEIPSQHVEQTQKFELSQDFTLDGSLDPADLCLAVEADWYRQNESQSVMKTQNLEMHWQGLQYRHIHPEKKSSSAEQPFILGDRRPEGQSHPCFPYQEDVGHIVLCFLRYPEDYSDVDYMIHFGRGQDGYHPLFALPGQGEIIAPQGAVFLPDENHTGICYLETSEGGAYLAAGHGTVSLVLDKEQLTAMQKEPEYPYQTAPGDIAISGSGNYASYTMMNVWQTGKKTFQESGDMTSHYFDYTLRLTVYFSINGTACPCRIVVSSKDIDPLEADEIRKIPPLRIMYGCFAEGTKILAADGSEIAVQKIRIGDRFTDFDSGIAKTVVNVWNGFEHDDMIRLECQNGGLTVTGGHPVRTPGGMVRAADLVTGDLILCKNGAQTVTVTKTSGNCPVYNIEFEEPCTVCGGGILTGDMKMQNRNL